MRTEQDAMKHALLIIERIQKEMFSHQDNRVKKVGDRVIMWDYSYNHSKSGKKHHKFTGLERIEAIVIKEKLEILSLADDICPDFFPAGKQILDLLLLYPNGEEVYTASEFVKRTDKYIL